MAMKEPFATVHSWVLVAACFACFACTGTSADECDAIQREAIATVAASNTCTRDEDCALFTPGIESGITCRGLGYNKKVDPKTFDSKVAAYKECVEKKPLTCKLSFTSSTRPCQQGRCVDDVDAYGTSGDAGLPDSGR